MAREPEEKKASKQYTLLSRIGNVYHAGKVGVIGAVTATALALTLWKGLSKYDEWKKDGFFERAATGYFIAADRSLDRMKDEQKNLERYLESVKEIREELNNLKTKEAGELDERIRRFEQRGNSKNADKLKGIKKDLTKIDSEIKGIYDNVEQKLEEIADVPERLEKYSTIWRRAVKVYSFTVYEYLSYANKKAEEIKKSKGWRASIQNFFEDRFKKRIENTLDKKAEDSEKTFKELRERIRMYSQAELGKQGIANLMEYLNDKLENQNIGEGEKQVYCLIRDSVKETKDTEQAYEILDFLQHGKTPKSLDNETKEYVQSQKEILNTINRVYNLIMRRTDLVVQAEELGIELEEGNLERLDELTAKAEKVVKDFSQSNQELKQIGVSPVDPEYLGTIRSLQNYYLGALALLCLAEAAVGYLFAANSLGKRKQYALEKQHDVLAKEVDELKKELKNYENQADVTT